MVSFFVAFMFAMQQPAAPAAPAAQTPPAAPTGQAVPAAPRRAPAPVPASLEVRVSVRSGAPIGGAQVIAEGPSHREGTTIMEGRVTLRALAPGTYRIRAEGEGFVAFEKEVVVKGPVATPVEMPLSPAPPAPAPPPPAPAPAPEPAVARGPAAAPGDPRTLSIPDLAEKSLGGRDPVRTVPIGCSGLSRTTLVVVRETQASGVRPDQDEMLYLVAGEATLKVGDKELPITPGWFSIVPRGTTRSVTKKGRNPAIFLSTVSGQPCGSDSDK